MQYRYFGDGVRVSALGVGCGRVGSINNTVPMREIEATLDAAVEAGINLFDTADIYGQGDSELALGALLKRYPGRTFVVTKVGFIPGRLAGALRFAKPLLRAMLRPWPEARGAVLQGRAHMMSQDFSSHYLREAIDRSRRRLGVERLDGLMLHSPPHEVLVSSEIDELLSDLVRRQIVSHVGVSAVSIEEVKAALSIPTVTMLQVSVNVVRPLVGTSLIERLRARNIALFVREILGKPEGAQNSKAPADTLTAALVPPFVTAAVVGVSTRVHLNNLLRVVS
jgi:aryl-alcohol dehydrogenase-like predicted oxidoreductase